MTEDELLAAYRPWVRKVAAGMTSLARAEDLAQEGWIAIWRATQDYDGSSPLDYWLKFKARGRMLTVVRNWQSTPHVPVGDTASLDDLDRVLVGMRVSLPDVELAYHRGQIAAALDRLTPREREYVVARFWGGLNYPELNEHFGVQNSNGIWKYARPKLAAELAHLSHP